MMSPGTRARSLPATGAVAAAIMASACCWLPLALILFGASAASVAPFFEPLRPWFTGASVILLALGFYLVYFRRDKCADTSRCEPDRRARRGSQITLWLATAAAAAFLFFPDYVGVFADVRDADQPARPAWVELHIDGMSCEGCAVGIQRALLDLEGVQTADVSYEQGSARIAVDPESSITGETLVEVVERAGYGATPVKLPDTTPPD